MSQIKQEKKGFFNKFLDFIEVGGNKLPHPVTLFNYYYSFRNY